MNELTQKIKTVFTPKAALIAYECGRSYSKEYYLELHPINEKGKMGAGIPVTQEFMNEIASSYSDTTSGMPHGILPENMLFADTRKGQEKYIWFNPPGKRQMFFYKELNIKDGEYNLPGLIYIVSEGKLCMYAFKGKKPGENTELFLAPFFNASSTYVCLGSSNLEKPQSPSFKELLEYWEKRFWLSEFSHLSGEGNPTEHNLVRVLEDSAKAPFDANELKPIKRKLKDILK